MVRPAGAYRLPALRPHISFVLRLSPPRASPPNLSQPHHRLPRRRDRAARHFPRLRVRLLPAAPHIPRRHAPRHRRQATFRLSPRKIDRAFCPPCCQFPSPPVPSLSFSVARRRRRSHCNAFLRSPALSVCSLQLPRLLILVIGPPPSPRSAGRSHRWRQTSRRPPSRSGGPIRRLRQAAARRPTRCPTRPRRGGKRVSHQARLRATLMEMTVRTRARTGRTRVATRTDIARDPAAALDRGRLQASQRDIHIGSCAWELHGYSIYFLRHC